MMPRMRCKIIFHTIRCPGILLKSMQYTTRMAHGRGGTSLPNRNLEAFSKISEVSHALLLDRDYLLSLGEVPDKANIHGIEFSFMV